MNEDSRRQGRSLRLDVLHHHTNWTTIQCQWMKTLHRERQSDWMQRFVKPSFIANSTARRMAKASASSGIITSSRSSLQAKTHEPLWSLMTTPTPIFLEEINSSSQENLSAAESSEEQEAWTHAYWRTLPDQSCRDMLMLKGQQTEASGVLHHSAQHCGSPKYAKWQLQGQIVALEKTSPWNWKPSFCMRRKSSGPDAEQPQL